ncbi:phosphatase PAP2 family protein [Sphingomonas sp. ASV193]|uniref:phosphatase PAP2 family protein n=1 Tax=Sphingomonas sp. ASV193 TaxID=3144405 RepID=UPI0032E8C5B1
MRPATFPITLAVISLATPAYAGTHGWNQASGIARDGLVLVALGLPAIEGDWQGDKQAGLSMGAAFGATELLKYSIPERRPDGSDDHSFPSGHTSVSFAAAATLEKRYGWQVGIPAHLVAAFVGVARVEARKHYWHDVIAGAAIGEASGWLLSSKRNARVRWMPWGDTHGGGFALASSF